MNIPNFDLNSFSTKDGMLDSRTKLLFDQLISALQKNLSDRGFTLPPMTSAQIADLDLTQTVNNIFVDSTTGETKININGVIKTLQYV